MATRTRHDTWDNTWFITFTCYHWLHLFDITRSYDTVYNWLNFLNDRYKIKTIAFVIMPNHVHLILHIPTSDINLNTVVGNGKRFIAYELIKRLTVLKEKELLVLLSSACSEREKIKGQRHKVFEPSFDAKPLYTLNFIHQKLDYIHHNPVKGKWNLCNEFTEYPHSSAAFYVDEKPHASIAITDYRDYWN